MTDPLVARLRAALSSDARPSSDFDLNAGFRSASTRALRPAAVLVTVTDGGTVILTKRSSRLKHHPGQIAFPGGKVDPSDAGPVAAALREAGEEVALPLDAVEVLGRMPVHETVTGFAVTPVIARVRGQVSLVPEAGEVEEAFEVPLDHLLDAGNYRVEGRNWAGQRRFYYVVPFGPYYIWGATARMLLALAKGVAA